MAEIWVDQALIFLENSLQPVPEELNELDWKEKLSTNKERLSEHLSAFANYPGGGFMIFGIEDRTAKVVGIDKTNCHLIIEKLTNLARNTLEPQVRLCHAVENYQGVPILIVRVKESAVKPVHVRKKTLEDSFIRTGGTTRKASRQEVGGMLLNSKTPRWEELHASKLISGQKVLNQLDYSTVFELRGQPVPENADEILRWMLKEKMVHTDNFTDFHITNFGAIAAARQLDEFDGLSRKAIRLIRYSGLNKTVTENEFTGVKGYAIGFEGFVKFLSAMLPQSEIIEQALRHKTTVYPEIALRELIANALIHQDFSITGTSPMVEVFDNRIEIRNPGRLLPSKK